MLPVVENTRLDGVGLYFLLDWFIHHSQGGVMLVDWFIHHSHGGVMLVMLIDSLITIATVSNQASEYL
jgi:hypothetical protein